MIRAVLDANIYVSALLKPTGLQARLVKKGFEGAFQIVISESLFLELCRVLNYRRIAVKLPFTRTQIKTFLEHLTQIASWTAGEVRVRACEDPDDDIYLACAQESQADFLVSGDRHLLRMKKFGETLIATSRAFLETLPVI